ncbi:MAG TPA: hypothetical protein VLE97_09775 [Gaiellaceae bacterium]|nr:hypothetical protein [Gaiellaceae bacterium]
MSDSVRRFLAVMVAILVAYFFLHVMRSFNVAGEPRGICAGIAGYMAGDLVASAIGRRRRKR